MDKHMSNGWRTPGTRILSEQEIKEIRTEIDAINAEQSVFVFNDENHINTCYNDLNDKVYIRGDILPDMRYASNITRDLMSIRAVFAHEYYGHRPHRQEYLIDAETGMRTLPAWKDEFRASYEAAKYCPNLSDLDRYHLIQDAVDRCREVGEPVILDDFMRNTLYGLHYSMSKTTVDLNVNNNMENDEYDR